MKVNTTRNKFLIQSYFELDCTLLPHHKYGSRHWRHLYTDLLSLTFLPTKDHTLSHFADQMAQFSAMNINLMSLNIHQGPNKKKKTHMYIQKQPQTMAVKQKLYWGDAQFAT
jgi:hypothetical protein